MNTMKMNDMELEQISGGNQLVEAAEVVSGSGILDVVEDNAKDIYELLKYILFRSA